MNDRIRELYLQAHSIRHYDGDPMRDGNPPTVYWQGEKSAEKFAELIVQECLAQVDKVDEMLEDDSEKAGVAWVGYAIEKHFGVEE